MAKLRHIDTGFYRISDREAGKLARAAVPGAHDGPDGLPGLGYEKRVHHPRPGETVGASCWLTRTPHRHQEDSPARGWVWALHCWSDLIPGGTPNDN